MTTPLTLFKEMLYIRAVEETIADRYAEQRMRCPVHLSIGQEAVAVGVSQALTRTDRVFSTHRCHAHYLAKGGDLKRMLAEIYGKAAGCCQGRGGSMHLTDPDEGMIASVPIVASSIPLAVGSALAAKIDRNQIVSVAYIGDGSVEEGVFHESANFASLARLPVLFVCENNFYSVYTPLKERQPERAMARLAEGHGIKCVTTDGNDVGKVFRAATDAVEYARGGNGPVFLDLETYRWREHCGVNYDNHIGYRTEEEFLEWKERDPLGRLRAKLYADGDMSDEQEAELRREYQRTIDEAFVFAEGAPLPTPDQVSQFVYA